MLGRPGQVPSHTSRSPGLVLAGALSRDGGCEVGWNNPWDHLRPYWSKHHKTSQKNVANYAGQKNVADQSNAGCTRSWPVQARHARAQAKCSRGAREAPLPSQKVGKPSPPRYCPTHVRAVKPYLANEEDLLRQILNSIDCE